MGMNKRGLVARDWEVSVGGGRGIYASSMVWTKIGRIPGIADFYDRWF